jgi:hypothetical protein
MQFVLASAAKAKIGALYYNCQTGIIFCNILNDMGHPQPKTPVHCDNATAVDIANNTVKRQRSRSMEMRFFWVSDKVALRGCILLVSTPDKKILLIIRASITLGHIMLQYICGISM